MYAEYFKSVMANALWNRPKFNQDICVYFVLFTSSFELSIQIMRFCIILFLEAKAKTSALNFELGVISLATYSLTKEVDKQKG